MIHNLFQWNVSAKIDFTLRQQSPPYPLRLPVSVYFEKGARIYFVEMDSPEKNVQLPVHDLPLRVIADEGYDVIRQLTPEETPPSLAMIMGSPALTVVAAAQDRSTYQPLLDALGVAHQVVLGIDLSLIAIDISLVGRFHRLYDRR